MEALGTRHWLAEPWLAVSAHRSTRGVERTEDMVTPALGDVYLEARWAGGPFTSRV
jgi:hypothetical protein